MIASSPAPARPVTIQVVSDPATLREVAHRCSRESAIAIDIEADGLFVFRPRLCCMQIAWRDGDKTHVAIVDTLAVEPAPLSALLGEDGPAKVLHDLTFDARMLDEAGVSIGRVRDTSVAARLLGHTATGLATLVEAVLGIQLDKGLQQHNWGRRPLTDLHLEYLAGDVAHLLHLDEHLQEQVRAQGIEEEVAAECAYKLGTATSPPRDNGPSYTRIKGASSLEPVARAVLRHLVLARTAAAEQADVPPFKIVDNATLLELARRRPATRAALAETRATSGRAARYATEWLRAIARGVADGDIPEGDRVYFERRGPSGPELSARRRRESQLSAWRREEAKRRSICEQAVLPGHCAQELVALLVDETLGEVELSSLIPRIPGMGEGRARRYIDAWLALRRVPPDGGATPASP